MSKLLIEEPPLQVLPSLAVKIGLNEAIILQQMHYWLQRSNNIIDGKKWIYNSYPEWNKQFPFWSERTLRRALNSLEKQGFIITGNYNKAGFDKTKWYTIEYNKLVSRPCGQNDQTSWTKWTSGNGQNDQTNTNRLPETTPENNITTVSNSKIENSSGKPDVNSNVDQVNEFRKVQSAYENTIGNLSSFVIQDINYWIKDTSSELIIEAIKRADANNVHNWKYVSSILKSWAKHNFKTLEQVQANDVEYRNKKASNNSNKGNNNNRKSEHFRPGDYDDMEERVKKGKLPF